MSRFGLDPILDEQKLFTMKKKIQLLVIALGVSLGAFAQSTVDKMDLSIFPAPKQGYKQVVIEVPHSDLDHTKKVEVYVGKYMEVDGCNTYSLSGELDTKDLQGWGYTYYDFTTDGNVASTRMGCPDAERKFEFVYAKPELMRYNGRMPIVVYVPEDYLVKYKIYQSNQEFFQGADVAKKRK